MPRYNVVPPEPDPESASHPLDDPSLSKPTALNLEMSDPEFHALARATRQGNTEKAAELRSRLLPRYGANLDRLLKGIM